MPSISREDPLKICKRRFKNDTTLSRVVMKTRVWYFKLLMNKCVTMDSLNVQSV